MFRHQQNASMNNDRDDQSSRESLKGFYSYKNTFDEDSVWLEIPRNGTKAQISSIDMLLDSETSC